MGQDELLREYRRAGVLCMPCRVLENDRDGIPNVLVEAMAAGAPVVATGVSGIPELVEHEVNGLLVEPDDPQALADALVRLHEDRELAARVGRGRPRAPCRSASTATGSRGGSPTCSEEALDVNARCSASSSTCTATARSPRTPRPGASPAPARRSSSGTEPDWLGADLPADEEWRIDWVKFYYGLDLAHAYRATGDTRYRDAWERLVRSYLRQVPPDRDPSEVTARRIVNWIYAWQRLRRRCRTGSSPRWPSGSPTRRATCARTLTPERNHRTLELYALPIVALALRRRRAPRPRGRGARSQPR